MRVINEHLIGKSKFTIIHSGIARKTKDERKEQGGIPPFDGFSGIALRQMLLQELKIFHQTIPVVYPDVKNETFEQVLEYLIKHGETRIWVMGADMMRWAGLADRFALTTFAGCAILATHNVKADDWYPLSIVIKRLIERR